MYSSQLQEKETRSGEVPALHSCMGQRSMTALCESKSRSTAGSAETREGQAQALHAHDGLCRCFSSALYLAATIFVEGLEVPQLAWHRCSALFSQIAIALSRRDESWEMKHPREQAALLEFFG